MKFVFLFASVFLALLASGAAARAPLAFKLLAGLSIFFNAAAVVTGPVIPEGVTNPLFEVVLPNLGIVLFSSAHRPELNMNLMRLLGSDGVLSLVPLMGVVTLLLVWIRHLGKRLAG